MEVFSTLNSKPVQLLVYSNKLTVNHRTFYLGSTYLLLLLFHLVGMIVRLGIGLSSLSVAWSTLTRQGITMEPNFKASFTANNQSSCVSNFL